MVSLVFFDSEQLLTYNQPSKNAFKYPKLAFAKNRRGGRKSPPPPNGTRVNQIQETIFGGKEKGLIILGTPEKLYFV